MRPTDVPDTGKQVLRLKFLSSGSKLSIPLDNKEPIIPTKLECDSWNSPVNTLPYLLSYQSKCEGNQ